ncbi:hypothetical protein O181_074989 [Austropuccinia psidii MF-1]|uniref:Reverse transcriptase RNase H-like domain-containing protein n=1 Tax=Austropuccinia psidii MF-1 TaxID=1389203 RepID=A0A9Q3F9N2_9BASI|nr:hypothetical protein [Austropuccinia psidii MF-1]
MTWILQGELPENVGILIDYGGMKGPRSTYYNEALQENNLIRRFIWEYVVTLERILFRIKEAGLTISGTKCACYVPELDIVGHVVSLNGRKISNKKIDKMKIASPLRGLTTDDEEWEWNTKCDEAFEKLRKIVGEEITLKNLDYEKGEGKIKLAVDSSYIAAGAVITQEDKEGKDRPVFYESITFSRLESKYSQKTLELCGVAKILKKLQTVRWGQHFELQVDAKALIEMIYSPCLPNFPMTRWVAFIQLFSFDLVHKSGKTFTMPDRL